MRLRTVVSAAGVLALFAGLWPLLTGFQASAQGQTPVFRSEVQQVEVLVSVNDAKGHPVTDLTQNEFQIHEDGALQSIASFHVVDDAKALAPSGRAAIGSDAGGASVTAVASSQADGRTYVLLLDSASNGARMCRTIVDFIDVVLQPGDQAAVLTGQTIGYWAVIQVPEQLPVTHDREQLKSIVSAYCSRSQTPGELSPFTLAAIEAVAVRLRQMPGHRNAIVLFSAGTNAFWDDARPNRVDATRMEQAALMRVLFENAVRMATLGNIPIHVVDATGLYPPDPSGQGSSLPNIAGETSGFLQDAQQRLQRLQEVGERERPSSLRLIAEATGGVGMVNTNNFQAVFTRILSHRWPTYVLSYATTRRYDARFHAIAVQVNRPGVSVRATPGYYAFRPGGAVAPPVEPPRGLSPAAKGALLQASPATDLALTIQPSVFMKGASGSVLVAVDISSGARSLDVRQPIELTIAALDGDDVLRAADRKIITIRNPSTGNGAQSTLAAFGRLTVPAGPYRIVAVAAQPGVTGSASVWVELAVTAEPLRFSDVVLALPGVESRQVVFADQEMRRELAAAPTLRRTFERTETLTAYVKVTDGAKLLRTGIRLRARVTSAANSVVWQRSDTAKSDGSESGLAYKTTIPLQRFEPGDYRLTFDGQAIGIALSGASRELAFTVR